MGSLPASRGKPGPLSSCFSYIYTDNLCSFIEPQTCRTVCVCVFQGGIDQIISTPRPLSKAWNSVYQWSGIQLVCCIWVQEWLITLDAQQVWETREPTKFVVNVLIRMTVGTAKLLSSNQWDFLIRHYFEGISTKERPRLFLINFWRQKGTNYYAFLLKHKYSSVRCVKKTKTQWDRVWYTN